MSKGMRLSKWRILSSKRPFDNCFGGGGLLACFGAPFTPFLMRAFLTTPLFIGGGRSCWRNFVEPYRCEWGLIKLEVDSGKWKVNNTLSLTLSWIIRGVGGVTSDLHLTGLRPTENPLPQGRGCAKDIHASESRSPLLLQFYMERVPKVGEGIINLKPVHTKNFNTTLNFPLSTVNLQRRCA